MIESNVSNEQSQVWRPAPVGTGRPTDLTGLKNLLGLFTTVINRQ